MAQFHCVEFKITPMPITPSLASPNRSLLRGLEILRAFRPGSDILGNAEIAERTGLPKSTVSRLTGTLLQAGFLFYSPRHQGYSLGVAVLSLSHAMRSGSTLMQFARSPMMSEARRLRVNIGLALADRDEMVYLETFRFAGTSSLRQVVSGQRVPMALTSLGRAYLSTLTPTDKRRQLAHLKSRHARDWTALRNEITQAIHAVNEQGWCAASWQPQVVAISTPIEIDSQAVHVLNMSVHTKDSPDMVTKRLAPELMKLKKHLMTLHTRMLG